MSITPPSSDKMTLSSMAPPGILYSGSSTPCVSHHGHTKIPISPLLSLPREIRDDIYAYILRAGDLSILRTSKQLGQEARERLYREGVCRIKMGFPNGGNEYDVFPPELKPCQNFHFRLCFGPETMLAFCFWMEEFCSWFSQFELLTGLNKTDLKRECFIIIEYCTFDPMAPLCFHVSNEREGVFDQIASLGTFATVVVRLAPKRETIGEMGRREYVDEMAMMDYYSKIEVKLKPGLGRAKLGHDADGKVRQLEFHPRDPRSWLASEQHSMALGHQYVSMGRAANGAMVWLH